MRGHRSPRTLLLTLLLLSALGGCSRRALGLFFDLPAAAPTPVAAPSSASAAGAPTAPGTAVAPPPESPRPAIEGTLDPDSAIRLLPRDHAGNIDWVAALRTDVIRPRSVLPGRTAPDSAGFVFGFDFFLQGPDTTFDAFFPHSTHTELLNCSTCHARIFPYRGTVIRMADVLTGKYCGECHGRVAFDPTTACERCHVRMKLPPNRSKPELIGTVTLTRAKPESGTGVVEGNAAGLSTASLPPAQFPHWVHRSRYLCKSCHQELFEPKAGANRITMRDISAGRACGTCHNGRTAFAAGFGSCDRCHVPPRVPAPAAPPPDGDVSGRARAHAQRE